MLGNIIEHKLDPLEKLDEIADRFEQLKEEVKTVN
jgi:hypothetical protein